MPPTGTVTFIFADIDLDTKALGSLPSDVESFYARPNTLLSEAIAANGGFLYKVIGHATQSAFPTAQQAATAVLQAQQAMAAPGPDAEGSSARPLVRMAIHSGVTEVRENDYFGPLLNRVARMLGACHGGQIVISQATEELLRDALPAGTALRDLGEHRLRDLTDCEHIYQLLAPGLQSDFPPIESMEGRPNNLPPQPTALVGRAAEVEECCALLRRDDIWLLTMTGPGGIGKSRLGIQVGAEMLDDFNDGVFFVPLASVMDPQLVIPAICQVLDIREVRGIPLIDSLREYLRDKQMLLLLDNFEQVVAAAPIVVNLLSTSAQLKIIVTSRMSLRVSIEREYPVPPLGLPNPRDLPDVDHLSQYAAVALFIARATAVKPDFAVTNDNAPAVAEICVRLDGLPLAIELAAARVKILSPHDILARLGNTLKLLTGGARDVPARQQTLRAAIDWSYDLLDPAEKDLFAGLSVFAAGCSFDAADSLWYAWTEDLEAAPHPPDLDVLDGLGSLVDKNLLRQYDTEQGEPRFFMLEMIREYGLERLAHKAQEARIREWHAHFYLELAEQAERELKGSGQAYWLDRLEIEHANLTAAIQWSLEQGKADVSLRLTGALWRFWYIRGHFSEGLGWLSKALDLPQPTGTTLRAKAFNGAGNMAYNLGDYTLARTFHEQSLEISKALNDTAALAPSYNNLGHLARRRGDYDTAKSLLEEALKITRSTGERTLQATNLNNLGLVAYDQGDYATARDLQEESLQIFTSQGDTWGMAMVLNDLGKVVFEQGDYDAAGKYYEQSLALQEELSDRAGIASALLSMGKAAHNRSDYAAAQAFMSGASTFSGTWQRSVV